MVSSAAVPTVSAGFVGEIARTVRLGELETERVTVAGSRQPSGNRGT